MGHENEYHDAMVELLEIIWGKGYMAPGGPGNVSKMLDGLQPRGKRILDIGCGIGGPAFEMATTHGANVVGIDLEAPLIERARSSTSEKGLTDQCEFRVVEIGPLDFDDASFDIVTSAGAVTQTEDKMALFAEIRRVLKPGGWFSCYEWMKSDADYSDDMRYWFKMEGLTYAMQTLERYGEQIAESGFEDVRVDDATAWYQREANREYDLIRGDLYGTVVGALGKEDADYFVENWRAMVVVIDNGEMRQGYCRGRKPS